MIKHVISIGLILLGLLILLSYGVGSLLIAPSQSVIGKIPKGIVGHEVSFQSRSGSLLSAWLLEGKETFGGVLLMHGVRSNRMQMMERARFLQALGYTVLLFDFQSHGESLGKNITFGYLEARDAEAAFDFLKSQLTHQSIGVIGVSLGGASAVLSHVANRAEAVVLEAVYPTLTEAVQNRMMIRLGALGRFIAPLLLWQLEPRLGFRPEDLSPIEALKELTTPLLMIVGVNDKHTTLAESRRMYAVVAGEKEFWAVSGAAHEDFLKHTPKQYQSLLGCFFAKHLSSERKKRVKGE